MKAINVGSNFQHEHFSIELMITNLDTISSIQNISFIFMFLSSKLILNLNHFMGPDHLRNSGGLIRKLKNMHEVCTKYFFANFRKFVTSYILMICVLFKCMLNTRFKIYIRS